MRSFQQKRGWRNIMEAKPVLMFLGILLLFFAWGVINFMGKMQTTRENRQMVENKVIELQQQKERYSEDIAELQTASGVEANIREKFGLAKAGEGLIVIVEDQNKGDGEEDASGGFFSFFKNWFR